MGTSEHSQPPLFETGESEPTDQATGVGYTPVAYDATPGGPNNHYQGLAQRAMKGKLPAWPTPTAHQDRAEAYRLETSYRHYQEDRQVHLAPLVRDARMTPTPFRSPSSPAATPASRSHTPGSDWARRMTAISGRRCVGSLTSPDPVSSWLRTLLGTSRWGSTLFWLSWKRTATPAGRSLYRLVPSTPSTGGIAFGSWPTPLAGNQGAEGGNYGGMPLRNAIAAWPTPRAGNTYRDTGAAPSYGKGHGWSIAAAAIDSVSDSPNRSWPTPDKGMADGGRALPKGTTDSLHSAVKAQPVGPWPTPKAKEDGRTPEAWERARQRHYETRKEKGTSSGGPAGANGSLAVTVRRIEEEPKGKLSGQWTLALMGFPPDWCDDLPPDPLGTTPT